jgi:hypothetical protein
MNSSTEPTGNVKTSEQFEHEQKLAAYQHYLKEREQLLTASLEVSGRYDQWILTMGGGALAVSLSFLEKIVPQPASWTLPLLFLAWTGLVVAVWAGLSAIFCSQYGIQCEIENATKAYENVLNKTPPSKYCNEFTEKTHRFNRASMVAFTIGIAFLCLFTFTNICYKRDLGIPGGKGTNMPITLKLQN